VDQNEAFAGPNVSTVLSANRSQKLMLSKPDKKRETSVAIGKSGKTDRFLAWLFFLERFDFSGWESSATKIAFESAKAVHPFPQISKNGEAKGERKAGNPCSKVPEVWRNQSAESHSSRERNPMPLRNHPKSKSGCQPSLCLRHE
jgi:hypothetical protein